MGDMLRRGMEFLATQAKAHCSRTVTYSRTSCVEGETETASVEVLATVGRTEREAFDQNGAQLVAVTRDYLIAAADLVLDSETVLPARGDKITEEGGEVYEVLPVGGEDVYRASDMDGIRWRIHTKRVASE